MFTVAQSYNAGTNLIDTIDIITADFNKDGNLDLVVANTASSNVSILLGVGDGTFLPAVNYDAQAHPFGMAASDFNLDGYLDI
ncbi:MAG: VCBS repeat-containing protein [Candidatus Midichloria sp.]|nr:VCBS repeat-containing protein [Candidatus Midichloria sp.]